MPDSGGDPHMTDMQNQPFDFSGVPHALHKYYSRGPFKFLARQTPVGWTAEKGDPEDTSKQYISGVDILIGDARIVIGNDAKVHVILPDYHATVTIKADTIDAPGHPGSTSDEPHPLMGVPHLNVSMPIFPPHRLGESGVWVDGRVAGEHPEDYVVPG